MNATPEIHAAHPIVRNITLMYGMSIVIAILVAVASLAGLTYRSIVYPTEGLQRELVPTDWVNLCLGLPVLLGSMWLARRGRLIGLMCWPGAIFFILYTYLIYVFAMHFNAAFLVHLSLVTLSLYTLISLVASIDGKAIQRLLSGFVIERVAAGSLAGQGILIFVWVGMAIATALKNTPPIVDGALANHITDVLVTPAWIVGGVLLWQRRALGYLTGLRLLLQGSMLIIAATIIMIFQRFSGATPIAPANVAVLLAGGLVCFVPFAIYARGVVLRSASDMSSQAHK